jgi:hypothetical protein
MGNEKQRLGFASGSEITTTSLRALLGDSEPSPNQVRSCLDLLADASPAVIFIDEFDRPTDGKVRALFADTVKILSDQNVRVTIVLVGVADTIEPFPSTRVGVKPACG